MKRVLLGLQLALALCVVGVILWVSIRVHASSTARRGGFRSDWSPAAAASYLDAREAWWQSWPSAQRDHGTVCISCHTVMPYALVRPSLRQQLNQTALTPMEGEMLSSIEKRVTNWQQTAPYYLDTAHAAPSRATEAVLNALILAAYRAPLADSAFAEAWALQETTGENAGGWAWQDFHEAPWESKESSYQGAAMMAAAVGMMPGQYGSEPADRDRVELLRGYLARLYPAQPPMNQLYVLWASSYMPGLLQPSQRTDLIARIASLQHSDGGWSLADLDPQRDLKPSVLDMFKRAENADGSDGCATGLAVSSLEESGVPLADPVVQRGLAWLKGHQYQDGSWWAASLNGFRDPASDMGRFMSDAATGYAVLALEQSRSPGAKQPLPASGPPGPVSAQQSDEHAAGNARQAY
jgi:squalene-hopene/tetraprenyl-beta-curcumene cyclase